MRKVVMVLVEMLVIAAIGAGGAFAINSMRGKNSLHVTRNYFPQAAAPSKPATTDTGKTADPVMTPTPSIVPSPAQDQPKPAFAPVKPKDEPRPETPKAAKKHVQSEFKEIDFDGVRQALNDPRAQTKEYLIIDARDTEHFEEGHLPGAVQCDHYRIDDYIDRVRELAMAASMVIVYCNGGECEDSLFVCRTLTEYGVPAGMIQLFPGGWEEWEASGEPGETGPESADE